ncbi:hypothetical protein BDF19DRAFT_455612 [Syncephalis fuscata]|nr:hypothetical protein BDF19DRAFT_455612 [Syncephalis fuscata]
MTAKLRHFSAWLVNRVAMSSAHCMDDIHRYSYAHIERERVRMRWTCCCCYDLYMQFSTFVKSIVANNAVAVVSLEG